MAIAQEASSAAELAKIDQMILVGFTPRQAFSFFDSTGTVKALIKDGYTRRQAQALQNLGGQSVADLIRKGGFTRHQAELIKRFSGG